MENLKYGEFKIKIVSIQKSIFTASLILSSVITFAHESDEGRHNTTAHIGFRAGDSVIESYVDFIVPIWKEGGKHLFFNPRLLLSDEGNNQFNVGVGFRHLYENRGILGANLFYDSRESNRGFRFEQIGFGLEWLGKNYDARVNIYEAQDEVELVGSFQTTETETTQNISVTQEKSTVVNRFGTTTPVASGNTISQSVQTEIDTKIITTRSLTTRSTIIDRTFEQFEGALDGWDAEIGYKLPIKKGPEVRVFGGYYFYENPFGGDDVSGAKGRIQIQSGDYLTFDVEYFENSFDPSERGSELFIGARLEVPLTEKMTWEKVFANVFGASNKSLEDRLHHQYIIRDVRIHTDISAPIEDEDQRSQKVTENTQIEKFVEETTSSSTATKELANNVYFVDPEAGAGETGAFESPFRTISSAVAAAPVNTTIFVCEAGGGVCDLSGGGGTLDETSGITLSQGQILTSTVAGVNGGPSFTTQNRPIVTNSTQTNNGVINTATAGGNTINRLQINVTAAGNNRHAIVNSQTTSPVSIIDNVINTSASNNSNAILNTQTMANVSISNNTITSSSQNGDGIENNATTGSVSITNNTFNSSAQNARGVLNLNSTGAVTINNNTFATTGASAEGIQNTNVQGAVTMNSNTITTAGTNGSGIINSSASSGDLTANNNTITTADGDGINSSGNTGDITLSNNTVTTNGTNREGIISSSISGDLSITGNTVVTNGVNSEAIQTNNSTGDIAVTGNTVNTSGTGAEGIINNNNAATSSTGTTTTVANNTVTTQNTNSDGIVNTLRTDVTVSGNTITTNGDNAEALRASNSLGALLVTGNIVNTSGIGSEGILNSNNAATSSAGTTTIVSNNTVTTQNTNSDGVVNSRRTDVSVSGNTVTTVGDNSEGLRGDRISGSLSVSDNTVKTSGTGAEGIQNTNITASTATIENNTVNTTGNNSEGIETNPNAANMPAITISRNTVTTQGSSAHALNTVNVAGTANINSNTLNTNQTNAVDTRNRTSIGGTITVESNINCVPVGGNHTNNGGGGTTTIGINTQLNQSPCP